MATVTLLGGAISNVELGTPGKNRYDVIRFDTKNDTFFVNNPIIFKDRNHQVVFYKFVGEVSPIPPISENQPYYCKFIGTTGRFFQLSLNSNLEPIIDFTDNKIKEGDI